MQNRIKIFISYAREDFELAQKLFNDLKPEGYYPWLDSKSLLPGEKWQPAIELAIKESSFFLALMSNNSVNKRGFVQKEFRKAIAVLEEFPDKDIYIIPVRINECRPSHAMLNDLNWVDLFPSYDEGLKRILKTLGTHAALRSPNKPGSLAVKSRLPPDEPPSQQAIKRRPAPFKTDFFIAIGISVILSMLVLTTIIIVSTFSNSPTPVTEDKGGTTQAAEAEIEDSTAQHRPSTLVSTEVPTSSPAVNGAEAERRSEVEGRTQHLVPESRPDLPRENQESSLPEAPAPIPVSTLPDVEDLERLSQPLQPSTPSAGDLYIDAFGIRFRWIPQGTYRIGTPAPRHLFSEPERDVKIDGFWLAETEMTWIQWHRISGHDVPGSLSECGDCPLANINWYDTIKVANTLSIRTDQGPCYKTKCSGKVGDDLICTSPVKREFGCTGYRLPTENEWEIAIRAQQLGTEYREVYGPLEEIAWTFPGIDRELKSVGKKMPNAWGLYDMIGNVKEWTWDIEPTTGSERVLRGGSYMDLKGYLSSATRGFEDPSIRHEASGFRLALGYRKSSD